MTETLLFLGTGLGFLALLILWAQQSATPPPGRRAASEAAEVLASVHLELPSREVGERIFARQDWDFIAAQTPPAFQRIFLQERKMLAISWLRRTRETVGQIMYFHRKAVRGNVDISPSLELRLAMDYVIFLLTYQVLCSLIWMRGPFCARRIVGYAGRVSSELSYLLGQSLAGLDPARLSRIGSNWSGGIAP